MFKTVVTLMRLRTETSAHFDWLISQHPAFNLPFLREKGDHFTLNKHFFHSKLGLRETIYLFVSLSEKYLHFLSKMTIWELSPESVKKKAEVFAHSLLDPFARTKWPFYTIFRVLRGAKRTGSLREELL